MYLIYLDEAGDENAYVFSALAVPVEQWQNAFHQIRLFRNRLKASDGIFVQTEFHAWKFVSGRGRISDRVVSIVRRCEIFREVLVIIAALPQVQLFTIVVHPRNDEDGFSALLQNINEFLIGSDKYGLLICDEGKESTYTKLARRRQDYYPAQHDSLQTPSAPLTHERILEDPFYKASDQSYFIQLVDFCAYALLRQENPLASKTRYGLDKAFELLRPILVNVT